MTSHSKTDLGRCLRIAQAKHSISGVELASKIGAYPSQVSTWRKSKNLNYHLVEAIANAFGMGVEEFASLEK